jgi:cell division protein FtsL
MEGEEQNTSLVSRAKDFMCSKPFIIGAAIVVVLIIGFVLYYNRESFSPKDEIDKLIEKIHKRQGIGKGKK